MIKLVQAKTDASRVVTKRSATINYICRNGQRQIQYSTGKTVDDYQILITVTLATREMVKMTIQMQLSNIIVESDSQISIYSITRKIQTSRHISNLIINIIAHAKELGILSFLL